MKFSDGKTSLPRFFAERDVRQEDRRRRGRRIEKIENRNECIEKMQIDFVGRRLALIRLSNPSGCCKADERVASNPLVL